ncbi:hypothetical protein CUMW_084160 [Citrus unshiu]|nr:hypothetical protein CUMW_084160 [Citrus unshiu]
MPRFTLGLKESSGGKSTIVGQRFLTTTSRILAAGRGGSRDRRPIIFSPLIKEEDLAFLEKEDYFASLEKIRSCWNGEVYKAELPGSSGRVITIKKIIQPLKSGAELIKKDSEPLHHKMIQIRSEIITAGQVRHRNIVPLLARMVRRDCDLLVYEFRRNGSLQDILYDVSQGRRELDWLARHRIAQGIASGLEYLHMSHRPRIIHRDIQPANVLIDDDMEARISEFGLAKRIPDGHTRTTTWSLAGTTVALSDTCDIYSFGVLLAVLVMGKFPSDDFFQHTKEMSLVQWMRNVMTSENPNRAINSKLIGNGYEKQMLLVLKIACFCTLDDPNKRPNSKDVSSGGKSKNVRQRFPTTPSLLLAAVRGGGQNLGPTIFSPLIEKEDLAFLEKEDCSASLEKIRSRASGEIYIAELPESNGKMIAIKKVKQVDNSLLNIKMRQVRAEIMTAGQIRHRNIVPLLAHMVRPDCHLLVSEFMKNGSLLEILNDVSQGRRELEWLARHRIARGIVSGLEYLHMYHRPRIIHRGITPSSVLIDDDMEARIADFGLARLIPDGHAQVTTSIVAGTVGYIAPEYYQTLKFSEKCDIYSFGVLLAVLVMGKLPSDDFFQHTEEKSLVRWMRNVMTSENPNRAIDSKLLGNGYEEQMLLVLKIACFCTLDDPEERPNSKDVRSMLSDTALIKDVDFLKMHKRMDFDNDDCDELIQQEIYTEWLSSLDSYNPL